MNWSYSLFLEMYLDVLPEFAARFHPTHCLLTKVPQWLKLLVSTKTSANPNLWHSNPPAAGGESADTHPVRSCTLSLHPPLCPKPTEGQTNAWYWGHAAPSHPAQNSKREGQILLGRIPANIQCKEACSI